MGLKIVMVGQIRRSPDVELALDVVPLAVTHVDVGRKILCKEDIVLIDLVSLSFMPK